MSGAADAPKRAAEGCDEGDPAAKRLKASPISRAILNYQKLIPGKRVGRYINMDDKGELADVHEVHELPMYDARTLAATLDAHCFELRRHPTSVTDFKDDEKVKTVYYKEMEELVKAATGAERVIVFDHTVRESTVAKLNSLHGGGASGAVLRVHTDYSDKSGPNRLKTLADAGGYTGVKLSEAEMEDFLTRDYMIVNVWRSVSDKPILTKPLGVLHPDSLDLKDFVPYEMQYPERVGENYALKFNDRHMWYFYPQMLKDECLVFKTFESRTDRPRYCFHSAFDDPNTPEDAPPRNSIEIRCVAVMPKK